MTPNATKVCNSVAEWIRRSLFYGESFEVLSKVDESWNPAGRYVVFEAKSGENTNRVTLQIDVIEDGRIPERTLKLEARYLHGRVRGLE